MPTSALLSVLVLKCTNGTLMVDCHLEAAESDMAVVQQIAGLKSKVQ